MSESPKLLPCPWCKSSARLLGGGQPFTDEAEPIPWTWPCQHKTVHRAYGANVCNDCGHMWIDHQPVKATGIRGPTAREIWMHTEADGRHSCIPEQF